TEREAPGVVVRRGGDQHVWRRRDADADDAVAAHDLDVLMAPPRARNAAQIDAADRVEQQPDRLAAAKRSRTRGLGPSDVDACFVGAFDQLDAARAAHR